MTRKRSKWSSQFQDKNGVQLVEESADKYNGVPSMCLFFGSHYKFHVLTVLAVAAIGIAVAVFITNFKILSIFKIYVQLNHIDDGFVKEDAIKMSQVLQGTSGDSNIVQLSHKAENQESFLSQGGGNFQKLSCSGKQKGSCGKVDKRQKLSLQEFHNRYDGKWPVIVTDVMSSWPAINWTADFFKNKYGKRRVTMTTFANSVKSGFSVPLKIFLEHLHMSSPRAWTYLQDEMFLIQHPELREDVLQTVYMEEDLFKLLPSAVRPWDCMLLWGTAHSRSSLHIDPYNWTGTNAVISGHKLWKLLPPGQDNLLSVRPGMRCGFPLECVKYNSDLDLFDPAQQDRHTQLKFLEAEQGPGEIIFIPPGWFHQAYNEVPTLAVSGQMMNSNNYHIVLEEIFKGGSLKRSSLPENFGLMTPREAVAAMAARISQHVLEEGVRRTEEAIQQLYMPQP
ncbi:bifunctional arginine demethylase and lysyl-hydroxylase JMJD6-like [Elysia marginata]|uniref:Bifunctional arginine demethylase and lysyl-hydroxylase JMJD6-like n=1 Tax=Elysia marginata TaxID=1093978 RepID=A0AAV4ERR8_9GAST|nr:bifunctional arginine demethylase and lysyl-hydroxylase JMJD6-like [Elysia marginata]